MKKRILLYTLLILSALSFSRGNAQPHKHRHHRSVHPGQVTTVKGPITEWTYNDDFEYDGLYLNTGNETLFVKFPPHLGQSIRELGKNLTVEGVIKYTPEGHKELKMASISGNGKTVYDRKPASRFLPHEESFVNNKGKIVQMQTNKKGDTCGYILDSGTVLRLPPHIAMQLSGMLGINTEIGYTGIEKILKEGHVKAQSYKIIRCQTISVNGTQYMVN